MMSLSNKKRDLQFIILIFRQYNNLAYTNKVCKFYEDWKLNVDKIPEIVLEEKKFSTSA